MRALPVRTLLGWLVFLALAVAPARGEAADDCPRAPPESPRERRALASLWFGRAEGAEAAGLHGVAFGAYSCSFTIVPHPFTAYNLARVAEEVGDLKVALLAYRDYLRLETKPADRSEVEARIGLLEARLRSQAPVAPKVAAKPKEPTLAQPAHPLAVGRL